MRYSTVLLLLLALGCTSEVQDLGPGSTLGTPSGEPVTPDSGIMSQDAAIIPQDAGVIPPDSGLDCQALDEAACPAADCHSLYYAGCDEQPTFFGCFDSPYFTSVCADIPCPKTCEMLDEAACVQAPQAGACRANYCTDPVGAYFASCTPSGARPVPCPATPGQ